jgi:protein-tyrosine-phosphatase
MHLLFVCTGNTCRSPLAEGIARRLIADRQLADVSVSSAGTSAWPDSPASDGSLLVALEHGIDLSEHRATPLSTDVVAAAHLILAMGPHHLDRAEALGGTGRSHLLTAYAAGSDSGPSVNDPFGGDLDVYRATYDELVREIGAVLDRITVDKTRPSA